MKKVIICGFISIISTIWALVISAYVQFNLVSEWYGNRFWASAVQLGVAIPLIVSLALFGVSVVCMIIEYFRNDR